MRFGASIYNVGYMTPQQAIDHFGTQGALADALGISQPAVAQWVAEGRIPDGRQAQLQIITAGKLKAEALS